MSQDRVVLSSLDKEKFDENVSKSLGRDCFVESCYTTFNDAIVEMIGEIISEILEKDGWELKKYNALEMFSEKDSEKIFDAFLKNSEFIVTLKKKVDEQKYEFKEVIVKFDFPDDEKKEIAKLYLENVIGNLYYLEICFIIYMDEVNVDALSDEFSKEVYGLLTPEEIKNTFKDWIEEAIDKINKYINDEEDGYDD
jgi:hypothetical protein